ncbi:hypothetical protein PLANPX_3732 [Lacipirellula parvula]|uniref:Uncharacterized protein n=1 Tax=Lacipirellula parvula TaxID=2650471 RepID=A0A5K7XBF1_9BACT|nr:hypothetical protein PLANPX_3732 [Lacipirellula parvula]
MGRSLRGKFAHDEQPEGQELAKRRRPSPAHSGTMRQQRVKPGPARPKREDGKRAPDAVASNVCSQAGLLASDISADRLPISTAVETVAC